jgi:quercetin dioxygenase-like cupin family protein
MGRVVTFAQLPMQPSHDGVARAAITADDAREMAAELVRIAPGARWTATVPPGSDCYLFCLAGAAGIAAGTQSHYILPQTFVTIEEGTEFALHNTGPASAELVHVLAPPAPNGRAGFHGTIAVAARATAPMVAVPEQKKTRIYFVDVAAARSERGHAMIVGYAADTVTGLHHHPDAESLFVVLDGALTFTVDGAAVVVRPGQAAWFGTNDPHSLRVADGVPAGVSPAASFLEFHIPAAYTTVKHP